MSTRIDRLQAQMVDAGVDMALLSVGPDLAYLTGYHAKASERLTMLGVPSTGDPWLVVPRLEAPLVPEDVAEVVVWDELDDPVSLVAGRCAGSARVAIGDHTWSVFLVRMLGPLENVAWSAASDLTGRLRMIKDEAELDALRNAGAAVDRVLARVPTEVGFAGRTESVVSADLMRMTLEEGHETAEFAIVGSGANGASPHHTPGSRVILEGDVVVCDFGGSWAGYQSDVTRTLAVGEPSGEAKEVHAVVAEANRVGREAVAPGVICQDIDRATRKVVVDAGLGDHFIHRTGHGIGLEVHEHPYMVEGNDQPLSPGMTFSVEPGVYLSDRFGVRIEDIVACAPGGREDLNSADRSLMVVG